MPGSAPPSPTAADALVAAFLDGTLDRTAWTHEAHLLVCHHLLQAAPPSAVLADLRTRIPDHNERVGEPAGRSAYHETVTRYFVEAVAASAALTCGALLAAPACQRDAPRRHWSPAVLGSPEARRMWVPPDLDPLPWSAPR